MEIYLSWVLDGSYWHGVSDSVYALEALLIAHDRLNLPESSSKFAMSASSKQYLRATAESPVPSPRCVHKHVGAFP